MSDLQRNLMKGKLPHLDEEESHQPESAGVKGLQGLGPIAGIKPASGELNLPADHQFKIPLRPPKQKSYTPTDWSTYWTHTATAALSTPSSLYKIYYTPPTDSTNTWFVFHHGAGSSALTFSLSAKLLHDAIPHVGVAAYDARGHGHTAATGDDSDLSLATLARDFISAVAYLADLSDEEKQAEVVFVGHSLGGAVVTEAALKLDEDKQSWPSPRPRPLISGVVVVDVVEGSALEGLAHMRAYLGTRPSSFRTVEDAIRWHVKSHTVRSAESACVSVPPLVRTQDGSGKLVWRTELGSTERYWQEWFADLSSKFLRARAGRLLVLAGTDRLDKPLTIGQMQGKYQLEVLPEVGHFVQEDAPQRFAGLLEGFWGRNRRGAALERAAGQLGERRDGDHEVLY
ncbi:Alpha/Beta hydrolase protein [Myxozyma melibiosi]|uniref:Protein phosphatase methylesterase 1 n=1 Tax=Myxozyma melibiosi TaxID=54550 RepID=A0ABR1EXT5_9ASCO